MVKAAVFSALVLLDCTSAFLVKPRIYRYAAWGSTCDNRGSRGENPRCRLPVKGDNLQDDSYPPSLDRSEADEDESVFLRQEMQHLEDLDDILAELEDYDLVDEDDDEENGEILWEKDSLAELLEGIEDDEDDLNGLEAAEEPDPMITEPALELQSLQERVQRAAATDLEKALLNGVVPATAGVGSNCLPGDWGFDPLDLASKDYFCEAQNFLTGVVSFDGQPGVRDDQQSGKARPTALILRDYREAEIRHGRLAMLAAMIWPLQELLDRFVLGEAQPLMYSRVTLPFFPLAMTAIMLLLGYLDVYSKAIKEADSIGEAFLPGDCFWDPLRILEGAPAIMKRNMQERELFNGRVAMLAIAAFLWEEGLSHKALVDIPGNELLLEPAYQVPFIQQWLDERFVSIDPDVMFFTPLDIGSSLDLLNSVS